MGFISSGQSNGMIIYLTPKAIEYMMGKKSSSSDLSITYFSLGDSDANYNLNKPLGVGFVPDLSGDDLNCLGNIATDFDNSTLYNNWVVSTDTKKGNVPPNFFKSPITL